MDIVLTAESDNEITDKIVSEICLVTGSGTAYDLAWEKSEKEEPWLNNGNRGVILKNVNLDMHNAAVPAGIHGFPDILKETSELQIYLNENAVHDTAIRSLEAAFNSGSRSSALQHSSYMPENIRTVINTIS